MLAKNLITSLFFLESNPILLSIITFLVALIAVIFVHPLLVRIAKEKNIVDNPNPRKLQRRPIPVLGGVGVMTGILISLGLMSSFFDSRELMPAIAIISIMLFIGVTDDILDLPAHNKLIYQLFAIALLMWCGGYIFTNMSGIFGIERLPFLLALLLTMLGCTGMITAVNFIDGVDGLVSGYGITVTLVSGITFWTINDIPFALISFATCGALIPFFLHNVFGNRLKMFFGDGGSMALGVIFSIIIIHFLQTENIASQIYCPLGFITALFSIILFDGLRVIIYRLKKRAPWGSGKHHLHHIFIDFGCKHLTTTLIMLILNLSNLLIWYLSSYIFKLPQELVLAIVVIYGLFTVYLPAFYHAVVLKKEEKEAKASQKAANTAQKEYVSASINTIEKEV